MPHLTTDLTFAPLLSDESGMQHWICVYCHRMFLRPDRLIAHLYDDHLGEMAKLPELAEEIIVLTSEVISLNMAVDEADINLTEEGGMLIAKRSTNLN